MRERYASPKRAKAKSVAFSPYPVIIGRSIGDGSLRNTSSSFSLDAPAGSLPAGVFALYGLPPSG